MSSYDQIAEWYHTAVDAVSLLDDPIFVAVNSLVGNVADQAICDLACGQGRVARYLAHRGAIVTGIDRSGKLLAFARAYEDREPQEITYLEDDARSLISIGDEVFNGIVCHMALMDIPDLEPTLQTAFRILRPEGWFVFSILHPCFQTVRSGEVLGSDGAMMRTVGGYFEEGFWKSDHRPGPPGKIGAYHRTLSTYLSGAIAAGFVIDALVEPQANGTLAERRPVWREVPYALAVRLSKVTRKSAYGSTLATSVSDAVGRRS